jgi:hypothetical protein
MTYEICSTLKASPWWGSWLRSRLMRGKFTSVGVYHHLEKQSEEAPEIK